MAVTLDDLKAPGLWKFTAHADGSDKGGRFSINFYECEVAGVKVHGQKTMRGGAVEAVYVVGTEERVSTLAEVVEILNKRFTAGTPEDRDD